jgi:serine/threonine protein kinase
VNADDPATFTVGYTLEAVAARTDHSLVFVANERGSGRRVAIKVARDTQGADALRREIQVLRGLCHPHIVDVVEATALGHPWMVTPLAPTTLEAETAGGTTFAADEVAGVMVSIAAALTTLHRHRLVHGDVKPSNILLDADGRPFLADFGSAHPTGTTPTQFTPTYFVDDGPDGDVASLARCGLTMLGAASGERADALRAVLCEFARAGDRADVFADAVTAMVEEPRWPLVTTTRYEASGEPTLPYGPGPPRPTTIVAPAPPRTSRRMVALIAIAVVAIGVADHIRGQQTSQPAASIEAARP